MAAGAIGSPNLLMLSGIIPAGRLRETGVDPFHSLPGDGKDLTNHDGIDI